MPYLLSLYLLWKRKRNIGELAHPKYRKYTKDLCSHKNIILIDPEAFAWNVIKSSSAVISIFYTSTALIAKELGKPSVYYDPTGLLHKNDRDAHGIPILSNSHELNNWILNLVNNEDDNHNINNFKL